MASDRRPMFTPEQRVKLRSELLQWAANDRRISGAAITGSAADEREDRWSDIDLAFGINSEAEMASVLTDWTTHMYDRHRALHHFDVKAGAWTYRVFLLSDTLQVDLAFVTKTEFRPLAPTFRLVFGTSETLQPFPSPLAGDLIGLGWLYALHARSSIARGTLWQAEHMISGLRDHVLALSCMRHCLPAVHGRGIDMLPEEVTAQLAKALVRELDPDELQRAFGVAVKGLLFEIGKTDAELAERLNEPLSSLARAIPADG
jgi:hypothetical protein